MASLANVSAVLAANLVCALGAASALAQGAVRSTPDVSSIRDTPAGETVPQVTGVPGAVKVVGTSDSGEQAPLPGARAGFATPLQKLYPFRVKAPDMKRRIEIRSANDEVIARCVGSCNLSLPEGEYVARNYGAEGAMQESGFTVEGPGGIELQDGNATAASVGLTLGIVGPLAIVTGAVLFLDGAAHSCLMSECQPSGQAMLTAGMVTMAAGSAMTPIGWVMWARNRQPRWSELSVDVNVAVVPSREGAIFGFTGRF